MFRFFSGKSFTSSKTDGSGAGVSYEHDQLGMCISTNQIESPQGGLIPFLKGNETSRNITLPQYMSIIFLNLSIYISVKATQQMKP